MITPRATRLVRVVDLHEFRRALRHLCPVPAVDAAECAVLVPSRAAAATLARTLELRSAVNAPLLLTREQLYDDLGARLDGRPAQLSLVERDAIMQAAAAEAADRGDALPFRVRPGLVAEMLRFYDHLRRQSQQVSRFEELIVQAVGATADDSGAERLLRQTHFLADAFRAYEHRVVHAGRLDEHLLRARLIAEQASRPLARVVVTLPDWIADPAGLFVADFELLSQLPLLQSVDLVVTASTLDTGFGERVRDWLPGLEETDASTLLGPAERVRPLLIRPESDDPERSWFTYRDREEELLAVARRMLTRAPDERARSAVVFKQPLPYLYLAPQTLGAADVDFEVTDALPLAAEPIVATIDLLLDAMETRFSREAVVALLRSPYLKFVDDVNVPIGRSSIAALNEMLSDARYLGGLDRLEALSQRDAGRAGAALGAALRLARELSPLLEGEQASSLIGQIVAFLDAHVGVPADTGGLTAREERGYAAMMQALRTLAAAHARHHDPDWTLDDLAAAIRRWIGSETFVVPAADVGVRLLDDQAARYGDFDDITVVGLVEHEWPERPRRNIFYPPAQLKALGWPSEKDRRAAADARFLDLLASASKQIELSVFTLDDEAIVTRSVQLDEVPVARLSTVTRAPFESGWSPDDAIASDTPSLTLLTGAANGWLGLRISRSSADLAGFHGSIGSSGPSAWSVSALETYLSCPFKFFAQHVLKLDEEPDDEEVMDPRRQGQFVHDVFETFFRTWQNAGHQGISAANLDEARRLFVEVVDRSLEALPEGEAALERTRLLGSPAAAGLGEAVFRMEAERDVPVVERLLEHPLKGRFSIATEGGAREVELRGKADRLDLLADGTFRLIDYKLGWPPDRGRALQLPIYGICAEQKLAGYRGRGWTLGEAVYLAFKGPRRVVPLFTSTGNREEMLAKAQQRLADTLDAIARGDFPPSPDDVFRCESCSFAAVCRKDYVGEV